MHATNLKIKIKNIEVLPEIKKKNVMNYLLEAIYYRSRLYNPILCERNDIPHKK